MQSLLSTPKDEAELELLSALLARLDIATIVIDEDGQEDVGLRETNGSEYVNTIL